MDNVLPFPIHKWSTDPSLANLVGQTFTYQGLKLMLVKAGAALTSPGGKFQLWSDSSEDAATISGNTGAATDPGAVAGLVPALLSGNVTSNAYLFVIRGGKENNNGGNLNSVAIFSSAQVAGAGFNIQPISSGIVGVVQISSTVQQGFKVGETRQVTSSSTWLSTTVYPTPYGCAEVEVKLGC